MGTKRQALRKIAAMTEELRSMCNKLIGFERTLRGYQVSYITQGHERRAAGNIATARLAAAGARDAIRKELAEARKAGDIW